MTDTKPRRAVRAQVEEELRRSLREAIAATGLRETARAVGISTPGLVQFLDGATPRSSTLALFRAWYFAQPRGIDPPPVIARAALDLLVEPLLFESTQRVVVARILSEIAAGHRLAGTRPPRWLDELPGS